MYNNCKKLNKKVEKWVGYAKINSLSLNLWIYFEKKWLFNYKAVLVIVGEEVKNELVIRKASSLDIESMEQFYRDVTEYLSNNINYPAWEKDIYPARADAEKSIRNQSLIVATLDNEIVGSAIINNEYPTQYNKVKWLGNFDDNEILIIHTFAVSPKHSKKGVGVEMIKWIESYAKKNGVKSLRLDCYEVNPPAQKLYEKCGFIFLDTISIGLEAIGLDWFMIYEKLM